jgi:hypothetical protein
MRSQRSSLPINALSGSYPDSRRREGAELIRRCPQKHGSQLRMRQTWPGTVAGLPPSVKAAWLHGPGSLPVAYVADLETQRPQYRSRAMRTSAEVCRTPTIGRSRARRLLLGLPWSRSSARRRSASRHGLDRTHNVPGTRPAPAGHTPRPPDAHVAGQQHPRMPLTDRKLTSSPASARDSLSPRRPEIRDLHPAIGNPAGRGVGWPSRSPDR